MEDSLDAWATSITSIPLRHPKNANKRKRKKCRQRHYFRPGHEHSSSLGCIIEADNEDCCSSIRTTDTSRSAASRKKRHTQNSEASLANIIYEDEDDDEDDDDVHRQLISAKALEVKINDMVNEMAEQRKELEALRKENKLLIDALGMRDKIPAAASATQTTTTTTTTSAAMVSTNSHPTNRIPAPSFAQQQPHFFFFLDLSFTSRVFALGFAAGFAAAAAGGCATAAVCAAGTDAAGIVPVAEG